MDVSGIIARARENRLEWHPLGGAEVRIRRPTRRQVVELLDGVDPVNPSTAEMFRTVDRCVAFVEDWRGVNDEAGQPVAFSGELLQAWLDEDIEAGQALVDLIVGRFNAHEQEVAGEKKA